MFHCPTRIKALTVLLAATDGATNPIHESGTANQLETGK
jgi:hypothetical protein